MHRIRKQLADVVDRVFPIDSPRRKIAQLVSVILLVEGVSAVLLFSYVGAIVGLLSLLIGVALVSVFFRGNLGGQDNTDESYGTRLMSLLERVVGGEYALMTVGAILVIAVILYNTYVSERTDYGDVDLICMMFGGLLFVYPFVQERWNVEATFSILFLGFVVMFLALPQVIMAAEGGGGENPVGNWYVHYMLAGPFASILDAIGVPSSSVGSLVTIEFQDGSVHTLAISAYCAGLYSFSIFISAFVSYVLVFERLRNTVLLGVLGLGLLVAYFGNLLRMVVIGLVGYYWGIDSLRWAHENAGWLIFISWSALFWWIILSRLGSEKKQFAS